MMPKSQQLQTCTFLFVSHTGRNQSNKGIPSISRAEERSGADVLVVVVVVVTGHGAQGSTAGASQMQSGQGSKSGISQMQAGQFSRADRTLSWK